ncbi:Glycosyltransferase involved in cell wall bisynthesis [Oribacterium sp. KHPX15]|uniref:glycosyltransferase family protein n=1 Tax=Oribacterium sp. KHPX15 TaxID=1855342 RepID=UPI00089701CB|nr:glycosyltransferase [Oribacterium sp. KHPX15]SEA43614.1 Glycosyltransferase involved in cell wall bisynthesis [Oribacterium sp. KHPX15]
MRIILFYSGIESFNYFTDEINKELHNLGHETFILDLRDANNTPGHSLRNLYEYTKTPVDAAIGYDQMPAIGPAYVELWNELNIPIISIFVDPPFRFGKYNRALPKAYLRFCCDMEHVTWCKRFCSDTIPNVYFLPHGASVPENEPPSWENKKYDILFSGTYYKPEGYIRTIREKYSGAVQKILFDAMDFMKVNPSFSLPAAVDRILSYADYNADDLTRLSVMESGEEADWFIRMYYREKVIDSVLNSGRDLWIVGRGWNNYPKCNHPHFHHISERIPFADSLDIMADARINLNVMPWFKDGTHERVFNTLLRESVSLTNPSTYLKENFKDQESIYYYELTELNHIPDIIEEILNNPEKTKAIVKNSKSIVLDKYTWKQTVASILNAVNAFKE